METIDKAKKLVKYLRSTKKCCTLSVYKKEKDRSWIFLFYLTGHFNNSYFSIDIVMSRLDDNPTIKIVNTTENVPEIYKLLTKFGLTDEPLET